MTEQKPTRSLPRLQRYLLAWLTGCMIVMVLVYTQLLDYYLDLGIDLRTQRFLEQTAEVYAAADAEAGVGPAEGALDAVRGRWRLSSFLGMN